MAGPKSQPTLSIRLAVMLGAVVAINGCEREGSFSSAPDRSRPAIGATQPETDSGQNGGRETSGFRSVPSEGTLTDVTESIGIKNPSQAYPDGKFYTPEITPGGVAVLDYDNDGDLDIYQLCHAPPGPMDHPAPNRLYQQQENGTFLAVPNAAGLDDPGFGHGVAVGDIDNDGDVDVFVSNYGPDALYRNEGDGTFQEITELAGLSKEHHWSSSAAMLDYDRDGYLDLYTVRFATYDPRRVCKSAKDATEPDYCGPHVFPGDTDVLYRNNGDGSFTDVTVAAGIDLPARGWGITCADVTGDGWVDIYIATDEEPALLWINGQDGTFSDEGVIRGAAFNLNGNVQAGMGITLGDANGDGLWDMFKTHITSETNTLYVGLGEGVFGDQTPGAGMGTIDLPYTGWGCGFFDYDHDGDQDLAIVNGRVSRGPVHPATRLSPFWNRFAEPNLLFANDGQGRFTEVGSQSTSYGGRIEVSRGLALGDLDRDGDLDLVVNNLDNTLRVYRNDAPSADTHWLLVRAMAGKRDAIGAEIRLIAGDRRMLRLANPAYGFQSSNDPRAHFGLGTIDQVDALDVRWPDGQQERFSVPRVDTEMTVRQGSGAER